MSVSDQSGVWRKGRRTDILIFFFKSAVGNTRGLLFAILFCPFDEALDVWGWRTAGPGGEVWAEVGSGVRI